MEKQIKRQQIYKGHGYPLLNVGLERLNEVMSHMPLLILHKAHGHRESCYGGCAESDYGQRDQQPHEIYFYRIGELHHSAVQFSVG